MQWFTNISDIYIHWLSELGIHNSSLPSIYEATLFFLSLLVFLVVQKLISYYGSQIILKVTKKSKNQIDDILFSNKVFSYGFRIIATYLWLLTFDFIFDQFVLLSVISTISLKLYMVYLLIRGVLTLLKSVNDIYEERQSGQKKSIKSYIQVFQLFTIMTGILIALSIIVSKDVSYLVTGIGAFAAVLMLVFKDSILGFVGGIQINANDMLRPGDWVSVPSAGADGIVIDISLTTVKIQNWDKTISTVPTYSLVSGSFHNWRGMEESGGRRIKRHISIDVQSIGFCSEEKINELKKIYLLKDYIEEKENELKILNAQSDGQKITYNGIHQTNIGIFRAYVNAYLKSQKNINQEMIFLVRQLQATELGLPIEIYVFSKVKEWAAYENIQSDIFDHLFAMVPEFDLRIFQNPSGADFRAIKNQ